MATSTVPPHTIIGIPDKQETLLCQPNANNRPSVRRKITLICYGVIHLVFATAAIIIISVTDLTPAAVIALGTWMLIIGVFCFILVFYPDSPSQSPVACEIPAKNIPPMAQHSAGKYGWLLAAMMVVAVVVAIVGAGYGGPLLRHTWLNDTSHPIKVPSNHGGGIGAINGLADENQREKIIDAIYDELNATTRREIEIQEDLRWSAKHHSAGRQTMALSICILVVDPILLLLWICCNQCVPRQQRDAEQNGKEEMKLLPCTQQDVNGQGMPESPVNRQDDPPPASTETLGDLDADPTQPAAVAVLDPSQMSMQKVISSAASTQPSSVPSPFPEDDWDDDLHSLADTGDPGIRVRALYAYQALEDDELTLENGDVFEKLEDEDDQGWCKGRLHGKVGIFPAGYVEDVPG